ncbi:hypothetical protein [Virgisporangium aurantiacum]|nr:hypothetical protein [Virgisporangium aurantiacum]
MRRNLSAIAVTLGMVLLPLAAPSPAAGAPTAELLYRGDLRAPGTVADGSGHGLDGTIETGGGGTVTSVRGPRNTRFLRFPGGSCPVAPCPQGIVRPVDGVPLTPADAMFSFGADVRLTEPPPTSAGMNVFQLGAAAAGLSQWKVQVDAGRPSCRWSDGAAVVLLIADVTLSVDTWYRIRCTRTGTRFETRVTRPATGRPVVPPVRQMLAMGPIVPTGSPVIGGKRINAAQSDVDTDQFHGDLDNLYFWKA